MAVTPLTDGNPLTYDWLNLLVADIQKLNDQSANSGGSRIVFKPHWDTTGDLSVKIVTGTVTVTIPKGQTKAVTDTKKFSSSFANDTDVMVLATINYKGTPPAVEAFCWVTNIDKDGCVFQVNKQNGTDKHKSASVIINYIAIGRK